jgi:hypothetical protein
MMGPHHLTRRSFVAGLAATTGLALVGCGQTRKPESGTTGTSQPATTAAAATSAAMTVYRDPSCGCCEAWAGIARKAGYQVNVIDQPDMPAIKQQFGVPQELVSCHTTVISGYAVEGHVPIEDVQRLLNKKPIGIRGIGVAGMPLGSPGMEVPDGTKQPFQVMAFDTGGRLSMFRA